MSVACGGVRAWLVVLGGIAPGVAHAAAVEGKDSPLQAREVLRVVKPETRADDEFFAGGTGPGAKLGFDREVLEGFARLHGLRLELVSVPTWDNLVPGLLARKGDIAAGRFTITPARLEKIDFTVEVFPTRHVVVTRKPARTILTREELKAARVAAVKGSAVEEAVLEAGVPRANVVHVAPLTAAAALKDGRATAVVSNVENALRDMVADPELQLGMYLGPPRSLAYGVRKDDAVLLKELNAYLETLRRSPTWNRLVVTYFGERGLEILKTVRQ